MKAVILAGGYGTRISEESATRPKPMVEIGDRPILWHIMKIYAQQRITDFIICCGYKGHIIKQYVLNYYLNQSDITVDADSGEIKLHRRNGEDWKITLLDTGEGTMTGGRLKRALEHVGDETFCLTYGDGVGNIDIQDCVTFHRAQGVLATLTAVQPPGRFGSFVLGPEDTLVPSFHEKPTGDGAWINGGFFVLEPEVGHYLKDDTTVWEQEPLMALARDGQLAAYRHGGFWHPMDTLHDKMKLQAMWTSGEAPWKSW